MKTSATLYLIPCGLGHDAVASQLPADTLHMLKALDHFIVERAKTARHFLRAAGFDKDFNAIGMQELNKHSPDQEVEKLLEPLSRGLNMGLISEAGVPGVADPGGEIVAVAHEKGYRVSPLIGPSSILLALMASGMNGQHFEFHGYLPRDEKDLGRHLRMLEQDSQRLGKTQLLIETPYRNDKFLALALKTLQPATRLCIATNITCADERILTLTIAEWRLRSPQIGKKPTVFALFSGEFSGRK